MRELIGDASAAVPAGASLADLAKIYETKLADDPMIKVAKEKTGKSLLIFIVNGEVIKSDRFSSFKLANGDDVRIHHPYFGG
jgi:sulfur carrier protein ThiS